MPQEIERKFLVKGEFKSWAVKAVRIKQGYIAPGSGRTVRVRSWDDKGYLTIKGPASSDGLGRFEWEKEISLQDVEDLMTVCDGGLIDKTRYLVPSEDGVHTWEVDEFYGDNEGLVMAEIELRSAGDTFPKPDWIGQEVTGDGRYYNSHLLKYPFKDWK